MTTALAMLVGILIGSLPTADWLSHRHGIDLRASGSRNPGTRNALQVGGKGLAGSVLFMELIKGAGAVAAGATLASDAGAALAAIGAVLANVYNPWFRFRGGKGLAIAGGTILAAWTALFPVLIVTIAVGLAWFRRSGPAAITAFVVYAGVGLAGLATSLPVGWGVDSPGWLAVMALGSVAVMAPKHIVDTVNRPDRANAG